MSGIILLMPFKDPKKNRAAIRNWAKKNPDKWHAITRKCDQKRYQTTARRTRALLSHAKASAKHRGLDFNIDQSDVVIPDRCPVFDILLDPAAGPHAHNLPSLDRIDSSKGYIKGNVWVISWRANKVKTDSTLEELELLVAALKRQRLAA